MSASNAVTQDQWAVLRAVYLKFRNDSVWPRLVDLRTDSTDLGGVDVRNAIESLPESMLFRMTLGAGHVDDDDRLMLTEKGMSVCKAHLRNMSQYSWIEYFYGKLFP